MYKMAKRGRKTRREEIPERAIKGYGCFPCKVSGRLDEGAHYA